MARAAQDAGKAEIATYTLASGRVYVSNGVSYIAPIDHGYVGHKPGFIQTAINTGVRKTRL